MRVGQTSAVYFIANIASSALGFAATVYFTRTLDEDLLGKYFVIVAVLIWGTVALGRPFQSAVTKRLSETDDGGYLTAGLVIQTGAFLFVAMLFGVLREPISRYLGADVVGTLITLLFFTLGYKFVVAVLQGERRMHIAAVLQPVNVGIRSVVQVGVVFLGFELLGLLTGYGIAVAIATTIGVVVLHSTPTRPKRRHFRRLLSFAKYSWLGKISSRAFASMDTLILGLFAADAFIAYYEVAWNLASIFAIFGVGISQTLFPEMSKLSGEENIRQIEILIEDSLSYAGLFLIPGFLGSVIIGDMILRVYGPQYDTGAMVLYVLLFARLIYAYAGQFTNALSGVDRPDLAFRVNGMFIVVNVVLNLSLVHLFGWVGAAVATATSATVSLVFGHRYLSRQLTVKIPLQELSLQWIAAVVMTGVVIVGRQSLSNTWITGAVLAGVGGVVYFGTLYGISAQFRTIVQNNVPVL
jgi:O-antigen/teichoic acid export membrane protein